MASELVIRLDDAGQVSVTGPLSNKLICYAMLEMARDVVKDAKEKGPSTPIVAPSDGDMLAMRRRPAPGG